MVHLNIIKFSYYLVFLFMPLQARSEADRYDAIESNLRLSPYVPYGQKHPRTGYNLERFNKLKNNKLKGYGYLLRSRISRNNESGLRLRQNNNIKTGSKKYLTRAANTNLAKKLKNGSQTNEISAKDLSLLMKKLQKVSKAINKTLVKNNAVKPAPDKLLITDGRDDSVETEKKLMISKRYDNQNDEFDSEAILSSEENLNNSGLDVQTNKNEASDDDISSMSKGRIFTKSARKLKNDRSRYGKNQKGKKVSFDIDADEEQRSVIQNRYQTTRSQSVSGFSVNKEKTNPVVVMTSMRKPSGTNSAFKRSLPSNESNGDQRDSFPQSQSISRSSRNNDSKTLFQWGTPKSSRSTNVVLTNEEQLTRRKILQRRQKNVLQRTKSLSDLSSLRRHKESDALKNTNSLHGRASNNPQYPVTSSGLPKEENRPNAFDTSKNATQAEQNSSSNENYESADEENYATANEDFEEEKSNHLQTQNLKQTSVNAEDSAAKKDLTSSNQSNETDSKADKKWFSWFGKSRQKNSTKDSSLVDTNKNAKEKRSSESAEVTKTTTKGVQNKSLADDSRLKTIPEMSVETEEALDNTSQSAKSKEDSKSASKSSWWPFSRSRKAPK